MFDKTLRIQLNLSQDSIAICVGWHKGLESEVADELWVSVVQGKGKQKVRWHGSSLHDDGAIAVLGLLCRDALQNAVPVSDSQYSRCAGEKTHHLCKGGRLLLLCRFRLHLDRLRTPSRLRRRSPDLGSVLRRRIRELVTDRSRTVRVLLRMLRKPAWVRRPRRGGTHSRGGFDLADRVLPPERARRVRPARALTQRLRRCWLVHRLRLGDVDRRWRTLRLAQRRLLLLLWRLTGEGGLELGGREALSLFVRAVLSLRALPNQPRLDVRVVISSI